MSAINLRNVKRDFAQLNYRPDICHPNLINELNNILDVTGLKQEYDAVLSDINTHLLINIIKHVCEVCYSRSHDTKIVSNYVNFLAKIYTEHCVNDTVKRTVTKCLKSCPEKCQPELFTAISSQFISIMDNKLNLCEIEFLFKTLNECCDKFPDVFVNCREKVFVFFEFNLRNSYGLLVSESSPTEKISTMRCIHEAFRFFITAVNKQSLSDIISPTLNKCFMDLLDSDSLPMETLFNCCISIVHLNKENISALKCWKLCSSQFSTRSDLVKLGFCLAILSTFTGDELRIIERESGKSICSNLYNIIMDTSARNMNDTSILLSSSRVFFILSKQLYTDNEVYLEKQQLECLIKFLWIRMDHYLDGVRHMARDTMTNIIKMKDQHMLNEILECLSACDKNSKAFYIVLTILSDKIDSGLIIKYLPNIGERLLHLMRINNSAITIFIHLMVNHYSITECKLWFNYWLRPLFKNSNHLDIKHLERIITKAVELTPEVTEYINDLNNENELSLKLYLICLNIKKNVYLANNENGNWMNEINFETLKKALHNNDENIRFIALNLILDCKKKSQPFIDKELELIKYFIIYNNKYEKASINQKHLSFIKKMLFRIKESQFSVTVRNNKSLSNTVTENYTTFRHWFTNYCFDNLFADANFFRRNFFLESLRLIQTCLSPTGIFELSELTKLSILINCIWDTYEQNKILAKDILTYKNQEPIKLDNLNLVMEYMLETSKTLSSSINPLNSITAGYLLDIVVFFNQSTDSEEYAYTILLDLMNELKREVKIAEKSLTLASAKGPMYGKIHTIRHLINTLNWQDLSLKNKWIIFIENISEICLKCEKLVSIVVNDSSPEGIVPMDDLYRDNCQVTSQMVLLCCWRTTKESSLLLGDIVGIIEIQKSSFNNNLIVRICSCLTLLLSETKHRGAFEQIYVAYLKVCSIMWKSPALYKIPIKYLEDVLAEIKTGLGETFCVTRRSAGMPFIIQALLCTNHDNRKIVNYTMEILINICENKNVTEESKVGVVHALNVLRILFRCSQLADLVGPFVSRAITISVILFNSSSWPIRNSSTLLLSTLVNRIFGVPRSSTEISWENCMSGQLFFRKYPELYDIFLNEFKKFSPMDMRPSLYPTLLIVGRLYPSVNEGVDCTFPLSVYIPYIFKCAQSPVMKTRMLAATSIAPQVTTNKFVEHLYITYNELTNKHLKENTMHGLLLQMFSLVEHLRKLEVEDLNKLVTLTHNLLIKYSTFANYSYVVQEVFLRCITYLWIQLDDLQYNSIENLYESTSESVTNLNRSNAIGLSKYLESVVLFLFSISIKRKTDFSIVLCNMMKNGIQCRLIFEIVYIILSEEENELHVHLRKFENILNCNYQTLLKGQLMANENFIELFTKQCTIIDSLIDLKYLVLSIYPKALCKYFSVYQSIDNFILKVSNFRKDIEISRALLCINGYLSNLESLDQSLLIKLTQLFEDIYYAQRSDDCKIACIDIIVSNYSLLINDNPIDIKIFLKLWTIIVYYSEDNSENVRKKVWCLMKKETNCAKSFELLFEEFGKHFDKYPSAVLIGLICWSYLDVQLPQDRLEGQVFDGGDTSEFKEFTIRQGLIQNKIIDLTNKNPKSIHLEISKYLQEWIIEDWTYDFDIKPRDQDLQTIEDFINYAKQFCSKTTGLFQNTFIFKINK